MSAVERIVAQARTASGEDGDRAALYWLAAFVLTIAPASSAGMLRLPPSAARPPKPAPKIASEL